MRFMGTTDTRRWVTWVLIAAGLVVSGAAGAIVLGGSNLGVMGYPDHRCRKPYRPSQFSEESEVYSYNNEVDRFVRCIREYVENADNDIQRIQEKGQAAIDYAKSP